MLSFSETILSCTASYFWVMVALLVLPPEVFSCYGYMTKWQSAAISGSQRQ